MRLEIEGNTHVRLVIIKDIKCFSIRAETCKIKISFGPLCFKSCGDHH